MIKRVIGTMSPKVELPYLKKICRQLCRIREQIIALFADSVLLLSERFERKQGTVFCQKGSPVIVSLTSIPTRLRTLHFTIESLLRQTRRPNEVILWLSDKIEPQSLPGRLRNQQKRGLTINFRKDVGSYTKIYYALKEFPDSIIVTCDDDRIYPSAWLADLWQAYRKNPNCVICHRAHEISIDGNGDVEEYRKWFWLSPGKEGPSHFLFATGVGGILYPPRVLHEDVLNKELFQKICPFADDIWLNIMAILKNTSRKKVRPYYQEARFTRGVEIQGLWVKNHTEGKNDIQMKNVLRHYGLGKCWSKQPKH